MLKQFWITIDWIAFSFTGEALEDEEDELEEEEGDEDEEEDEDSDSATGVRINKSDFPECKSQ